MTTKSSKKIGRRDMLKIMTAGAGGIAASAFLPKKWTKPVIEMGVSPVHAAASITTGTIKGICYVGNPPFGNKPGQNSPTPNLLPGSWRPLQDAVVSVDGMPSLTSTSNADGEYTILNVPVGSRTISCVPPKEYYIAYNPNPASNVPETVNGITPTTQDFYFEDQG